MNIPLNIDVQQILLHLFNFAILSGGLYLLLYQPVKAFMEARTAYYETLDEKAKEALAQAQKMEQECRQRLSGAEEEASGKKQEMVRKAEEEAGETIKAAKMQAEKIVTQAQETARREHQKMLDSAQKEVTELASAAAGKLIQESLDQTYEQFLQAAQRGDTV